MPPISRLKVCISVKVTQNLCQAFLFQQNFYQIAMSSESRRSSADLSVDTVTFTEKRGLIYGDSSLPKWVRREPRLSAHIVTLYLSNTALLIITLVLAVRLAQRPFLDPTVGVYCKYLLSYYLILSFTQGYFLLGSC